MESSGQEHLRQWADLHLTDVPSGFVGGWLRAMAGLARPLARAGVPANAVSVAALVAALSTVPLAAVDGWIGPAAACVALIVSGLLDALDGAVAVQSGRPTRVGFLLDSTLDRLADAALAASLAVVAGGGVATRLAVATVAATWWLEYVRARGALAWAPTDVRPAQRATPGERPTRMILTGVGLGIAPLALAALWAQLVIVGGSGIWLFVAFLRDLDRTDRIKRPDPHPRIDPS